MVYYYEIELKEESTSEYDDFAFDTSNNKKYVIYMGKDKFENDPLIKNSHINDLWFHVDKLSSAHIYLKLSSEDRAKGFDDLKLEPRLLDELAQFTKANSIKGNKANNVTIIYTPVNNLHTDGSMDTGVVTFKNPKKVKRINTGKRVNAIINKINKTKNEVTTEQFLDNRRAEDQAERASRKHKNDPKNQRGLGRDASYEERGKTDKDAYDDFFQTENSEIYSNQFRNENWVEEEFW